MDISNGFDKLVCIFRQICVLSMLFIQTCLTRVAVVCFVRSPFEIFYSVIRLNAVFVVHSLFCKNYFWGRKESLCNKSVEQKLFLTKTDRVIPCSKQDRPQHSCWQNAFSAVFVDQGACNPACLPKAGHLQKTVGAGYITPLFHSWSFV